ncbi:MAG TPA: hypothetical protein VN851_14400 [Thermoanaerobaculia bacterium]|nr:hypothetical protein [Thermoanaerobaculia bacterium]
MPIYRLFGRNVSVETPWVTPVVRSPGGPIDLVVEILPRPELPPLDAGPFFRSAASPPGAESWLTAYRDGERYLLRFLDVGDFLIEPGRIGFSPSKDADPAPYEAYLLGIVFGLWLELSGSLCLHASAVNPPSCAIGFLGFNRAGKSTLAASFLGANVPFLTDDVLSLDLDERGRVMAQPGFPQMRLWPASAHELVRNSHQLEPVHPDFDKRRVPVGGRGHGAFHDSAVELGALFLPVREGSAIELSRVSPSEAMIELVRHSFLGALGEAAVGVARRFERIAAVAARVPIFRLSYPDGLKQLPRVREAILERLSAL